MRVFEEIFFSGTHGGEALSLAAAARCSTRSPTVQSSPASRVGVAQLKEQLVATIERHDLVDRIVVTGEPERCVVGFVGSEPLIDKSFVQQSFALGGSSSTGPCSSVVDTRTTTSSARSCASIKRWRRWRAARRRPPPAGGDPGAAGLQEAVIVGPRVLVLGVGSIGSRHAQHGGRRQVTISDPIVTELRRRPRGPARPSRPIRPARVSRSSSRARARCTVSISRGH